MLQINEEALKLARVRWNSPAATNARERRNTPFTFDDLLVEFQRKTPQSDIAKKFKVGRETIGFQFRKYFMDVFGVEKYYRNYVIKEVVELVQEKVARFDLKVENIEERIYLIGRSRCCIARVIKAGDFNSFRIETALSRIDRSDFLIVHDPRVGFFVIPSRKAAAFTVIHKRDTRTILKTIPAEYQGTEWENWKENWQSLI
jgi:hypothetical protein